MIGVLVLIVGGLIFLNHYVRRQVNAGGGMRGQRQLSVLETTHLGVKRSISMVQVPGAVLVVGVTSDRINLLERIDDPDGTCGQTARQGSGTPAKSFKTHLRQLTASFGSGNAAGRPEKP
jgi:flagellar biogenesis protein FliO